jgi:hypothetical protein
VGRRRILIELPVLSDLFFTGRWHGTTLSLLPTPPRKTASLNDRSVINRIPDGVFTLK